MWWQGIHPQAGVWHEGFCLAPQASPAVLRALCFPLPGKLPLSVGLRAELLHVLHKSVWAFILPRGFLPEDLCLGPQTTVCVSPLGQGLRWSSWEPWAEGGFFSRKTGGMSTLSDLQTMMLLCPEVPAYNRYSGMSASPLCIPAACVAGEKPPPGTPWHAHLLECSLLSCSGLGGRSPLCISLSHCCGQINFSECVFLSVKWGSGYFPQFPQLFHEGSMRCHREGCVSCHAHVQIGGLQAHQAVRWVPRLRQDSCW